MMEHIKQPLGSGLCLACCVAMVTRTSLDDVLKECTLEERKPKFPHLPVREAIRYLLKHNFLYGMVITFPAGLEQFGIDFYGWNGRIEVEIDSIPAIVTVPSTRYSGYYHAAVYCPERRKILCPQEDEPKSLKDFKILEWVPVIFLKDEALL